MPSMKCAHCLEIKRCRMVKGRQGYEYLCKPCCRELGYTDDHRDEGGSG
jgi:hypothetical protein